MAYSEQGFLEAFEEFLAEGKLMSTYKCAFLYALADVGTYDTDDGAYRKWISTDGDVMYVDLNFVAARYGKYYWDVSDLGILHNRPNNSEINIFRYIDAYKRDHPKSPSLKYLEDERMRGFRAKIIQKSMAEPLEHLAKNFPGLYEKDRKEPRLVLDAGFSKIMRRHGDYVRKRLGSKLRDYLESINGRWVSGPRGIDASNPFFQYVRHMAGIFIVCADSDDAKEMLEKTVRNKVGLDDGGGSGEASVWGLAPTKDNEEIWGRIKSGDDLLFSIDGYCVMRGVVRKTLRDGAHALRLWGDTGGAPSRDLLIVLEPAVPFSLDMKGTGAMLVDPTIPDAHNFPILQVDGSLVGALSAECGGRSAVLDAISEQLDANVDSDSPFALVDKVVKARQGQQRFRGAVLDNYGNMCALCGISDADLLEAAHIHPVGKIESAGDVKNGICLCVLHHRMFDRLYVRINEDFSFSFAARTSEDLRSTCTKSVITESDCKTMPSRDHIRTRNALFGAACPDSPREA